MISFVMYNVWHNFYGFPKFNSFNYEIILFSFNGKNIEFIFNLTVGGVYVLRSC